MPHLLIRHARRLLVAGSTVAAIGVLAGTATTSAQAAPGQPARPSVASAYPSAKSIAVAGDDQDTWYYCGPAAVRNALSGRGIYTVQSSLAREMGTDENGTDSVANVTPVLNRHAGTGWYESKYISGSTATSAQIALLKRDILLDTNNGYVIVANILGTAVDTGGHSHTYSGGHFLDVVGYSSNGDVARIYDVANSTYYSMTTSRLATWIARRGYSA